MWNSHSIARHFNAAMQSIGRAVRPKSQWYMLNTRLKRSKNVPQVTLPRTLRPLP